MKSEQSFEEDDAGTTGHSWVSASPGGLWQVRRGWVGERTTGSLTPMIGSLCKIRVQLKNDSERDSPAQDSDMTECPVNSNTDVEATPYPRTQDSVLQVPTDQWFLLRMGEGQCDIIEGCLEGMRAGERCEIKVTCHAGDVKPRFSDASGLQAEEEQAQTQPQKPLCFTLHLHSFTPGQESWQMAPEEKWMWMRSHKERGGQRFGQGDVWGATDCYCRAVKLVIALKDHTNRKGEKEGEGGEEKDKGTALAIQDQGENNISTSSAQVPTEVEYKTIKAELHSNLSLCQLKLGQAAKARESSKKATELDPTNVKAWYRLGLASLQVGELGEARKALRRVLELQPDSASARKALKQVITKEKELDSKLGQRLSKLFN